MKLVRNIFQGIAKGNEAETNLLKQVPDLEMAASIVNGVRILAAGLTKIQQEQKNQKREVKKEVKKDDKKDGKKDNKKVSNNA